MSVIAVLAGCGSEGEEVQDAATARSALEGSRIYGDALEPGWADWSWTTRNLANRSPVSSGSRSISVNYGPWQGLFFHHSGVSGAGISHLEFQAHGGSTNNPNLIAKITVRGAERPAVPVGRYCAGGRIPANAWTLCRIPIADLGGASATIDGVIIQEFAGRSLPAMYFDDIRFAEKVVAPPAAPAGLRATATTGAVSLGWQASANATGYHVYRATSASGSFSRLTSSPVTATSYDDRSVTGGTTYWYKVSAVGTAGEGASSGAVSAAVPLPPPAAPAQPTATILPDGVSLRWSPVSGATGYHVYRSSSASSGFSKMTGSPITATTIEDRGLAPGSTWFYRVSAVNAGGEGAQSPAVSATIPTPQQPDPDTTIDWVYRDSIERPWTDGTWATANLASTSPVRSGSRAISASFGAWQAVYFMTSAVSTNGLSAVKLWVHGGTSGSGAALRVRTVTGNNAFSAGTDLGPTCTGGAVVAGRWVECTIPMDAIASPGATITGLAIQEWRGGTIPTISFDDIGFVRSGGSQPTDPPPVDPPPGPVDPGPTDPVTPGSIDATGLLPADRITTWNPGLNSVGGIPADNDRTRPARIHLPSGNPYGGFSVDPGLGNGSADSSGAIQSALDAAGAQATERDRRVVYLKAGTYSLSRSLNIPSYVTLRGQGNRGSLATRLTKRSGTSTSVINMGHLWVKDTQPVNVTADVPHGSRQVTVASNPGYKVGELVFIDQLVDTARVGSWWNPLRQGNANGAERGWFCRQNRPTGQVLEITAVNGNTLTFSTPIRLRYYTSNQAQIVRFSNNPGGAPIDAKRWSGVEDLFVSGGEGGDGGGNIHLFATAYSWVKNVESTASRGTSVAFEATFRSVLRDSFVHSTLDPNPGGGGYGIGLLRYASDNLIENNISWNFNKVIIMRATGGGNVIGYNYFEDGWGAGYPTIPEVGLNASHYATPHHELFEGNQVFNISGDAFWGNSITNTFFRNHVTGRRRSVTPLRLSDNTTRRFIEVPEWHNWFSYIGNVIGTKGMSASPQSGFVYDQTSPPWNWNPVPVWAVGVEHNAGKSGRDAQVVSTTLRHGNFDFVTNTTNWDPGISRRNLPASLYLTSKPAFFGANPWPWVSPENPSNPTATLPSRARFDSMYGTN